MSSATPQSAAGRRRRLRSLSSCSGAIPRPLPRLTGLADGLAPEERRYDDRPTIDSPHLQWVPRFPRPTGTQRMRSRSYQRPNACTLVAFTASAGRLTAGAGGLCDKFRDVLGVLAAVDLGRHLPIALRAALRDRVLDQRQRRLQIIEVRADLRDGIRRLERVTQRTAPAEQLLA